MMNDIHTIIFDFGGVLIDWNPYTGRNLKKFPKWSIFSARFVQTIGIFNTIKGGHWLRNDSCRGKTDLETALYALDLI